MRAVLRSEDLSEIIQVFELPNGYSPSGIIQEFEAKGEYKGIKGRSNCILMDGIFINSSSMHVPVEFRTYFERESPHLEMHFELKGGHNYTNTAIGGMDITYADEVHALYYFPEMKGYIKNPPKADRLCFEIELSVDFLKKVLNNDLSILKDFGACVEGNRPAILGNRCHPITMAMRQIISEIIHCQFEGLLKKVYLEAKVIELLSLQISQLNTASERESRIVLRKDDVEKLNMVRSLVNSNLAEPYSLLELSKISGLNNFKLKEGFKELFNNTIFGYLSDVRLEKAKNLLNEGDYSIAEISHLIGYKNPQHFTVAFKKKYGCLPSQVRGR